MRAHAQKTCGAASDVFRTQTGVGCAFFLGILPSPALADVCGTLRPGWDGRPATQLTEAVGLFVSPAGLFLSAALAVAVVFRHPMGTALSVLLWAAFLTWLVLPDASGLHRQAVNAGCRATPTLFIGLSAAICALAVFYTFGREKRL